VRAENPIHGSDQQACHPSRPAVTTTVQGFNAEPGLRPGHRRRTVDAQYFVDELAGK